MSKKGSFDERVKKLEAKEEKIKLQLDSNSDEVKSKVMRVGKIALITGAVALIGYWIFNVIFQENEDEEKPRKKKKKQRESKGFTERIVALAMPYVNKALDGILNDENEEVEKPKED